MSSLGDWSPPKEKGKNVYNMEDGDSCTVTLSSRAGDDMKIEGRVILRPTPVQPPNGCCIQIYAQEDVELILYSNFLVTKQKDFPPGSLEDSGGPGRA